MAPTETADPPPPVSSSENTPVSETTKTPVPEPLPSAASNLPSRAALSGDEQKKYDWLLEQVRGSGFDTIECPKAKDKSGPITDAERLWLTRECLVRYLRATKWHEKESEKRLMETLAWRREFGVDALTGEHISPENETGKQIILGFDKEARPCHYLNPGRQNTNPSHRQVEHLVFMVERVLDVMPGGQETLSLMINFKSSKSRSNTAPGIGLARECLNILQMHYPERLGRALIINVPWVVWGFFKLITPLIDPRTREKLKFNEDMTQYVPAEHLWCEYQTQGGLNFEYDHATYWPALLELCEQRRAERMKRWEAAGKIVGETEDYLFGHTEESLGPKVDDAAGGDDDGGAANEEPKANVIRPEDLRLGEMKFEEKSEADGKDFDLSPTTAAAAAPEEKKVDEIKAS